MFMSMNVNTKNEYQFIENELCEKLGTKLKIKKNIMFI